jgi:hypothetical protein
MLWHACTRLSTFSADFVLRENGSAHQFGECIFFVRPRTNAQWIGGVRLIPEAAVSDTQPGFKSCGKYGYSYKHTRQWACSLHFGRLGLVGAMKRKEKVVRCNIDVYVNNAEQYILQANTAHCWTCIQKKCRKKYITKTSAPCKSLCKQFFKILHAISKRIKLCR